MPTFELTEQTLAWVDTAPVRAQHLFALPAPTSAVFDRLADVAGWATWCGGVSKVRVDGPSSGVGAVRTIWSGPARLQERFIEWQPGVRLTFAVVTANLPGIRSFVEDWAVSPDPADPSKSVLKIRIGVAPRGVPRPLHRAMSAGLVRATRGMSGIRDQFM
jgi:hypothetical protein